MEYYSAIKRNEITSHAVIWMALETIIQGEVSQKEKDKLCIICGIQKNGKNELIVKTKIRVTNVEKKLMVTKQGRGQDELGN